MRNCVFILVLSALTVLAGERAAAVGVADFQSGNWQGFSHANTATGGFSHCTVSASYPSGSGLAFAIDRAGKLSISMSNPAWSMVLGTVSPVEVKIDRNLPVNSKAEVVSQQMALIALPNDDRLFEQLRKGRLLTVTTSTADYRFALTGTDRALLKLSECVSKQLENESYAARSQETDRTIRHVVDMDSSSRKSSGTRYVSRTELVTVASNLLSGTGSMGHQIQPLSETDENYSEEWPVIWNRPDGLFGAISGRTTLPTFDPATTVEDEVRSFTQEMALACDGSFASIPDDVVRERHVVYMLSNTLCANRNERIKTQFIVFATDEHKLYTMVAVKELDSIVSDPAADNEPILLLEDAVWTTFSGE